MLSLTPNHDDLAPALSRRFKTLTGDLNDAVKVERVFHQIMGDALHILCGLLCDWNAATVTCRLPAEVLASCFAFLPFEDRVTASHVSRAWRGAALAFPALWSTVTVPAGHFNADLIRMALSRSGVHPVDVLCDTAQVAAFRHRHKSALALALEDHMHHVRSVQWCGSVGSRCFAMPAPMLELLVCPGRGDIGEDFLGGQVGRLRTLSLGEITLPPKCLALSSLTSLSASVALDESRVGNLAALFELCPRLERMSLRRLTQGISAHLPADPAPPSLTEVALEASDVDCDLLSIYDTWNTERRIRTAHITMSVTACDDLTPILHDVVDLAVEEELHRRWITLTAGRVVLRLHSTDSTTGTDTPIIGAFLSRSITSLTRLESLRLPLSSLIAFVNSAPITSPRTLPVLKTLGVAWTHDDDGSVTSCGICVPHIRRICPAWDTLNIEIAFGDGFSVFSEYDVAVGRAALEAASQQLAGVCENFNARVKGAHPSDGGRGESNWYGM